MTSRKILINQARRSGWLRTHESPWRVLHRDSIRPLSNEHPVGVQLMRLALSLLAAIGLAAAPGVARPPVEIGTARAVAGQRVKGQLKVAEAADGTPIVLPLEIVTGTKPGPVAWV